MAEPRYIPSQVEFDNWAQDDAAEDLLFPCAAGGCTRPAQPEHTPCCSSTFHNKPLCCEHYCRSHFVEVHQCSPSSHTAAIAASVSNTKEA